MADSLQKLVWPPLRRSAPVINAIAFGGLVGAIEGSWLGALRGAQRDEVPYGFCAGAGVGIFFGGLTAWTVRKIPHPLAAQLRGCALQALCWLAGAFLIALATINGAGIGDPHKSWTSTIFFLMPPVWIWVVMVGGMVSSEIRCRIYQQRSGVMDLLDPNQYTESFHVRKFVSMVVLFAIRDRARAVIFEQRRNKGLLSFVIRPAGSESDTVYEVVPPPGGLMPGVFKEILQSHVPRHYGSYQLRFRCGDEARALDAVASLRHSRCGEILTLRLADNCRLVPVEEVDRYLKRVRQDEEIVPATALKHVCQAQEHSAIAGIATITGVSSADVLASRTTPKNNRAPSSSEILALLERITRTKWQALRLDACLDEIAFPDWPVLVLIRHPWLGCGFLSDMLLRYRLPCNIHCVVVEGGVLHDPAFPQPVELTRYSGPYWKAVMAFQPARRS